MTNLVAKIEFYARLTLRPAWSAVNARTFYVSLKPNTYLNM